MSFVDPFRNKYARIIVYRAILQEVEEALNRIADKYKPKLKDLDEIESVEGFESFNIKDRVYEYIENDKDLRRARLDAKQQKVITKRMVKQAFKDCFNEVLEEINVVDVNGEKTIPKSNKMLLAEKVVRDTLNGTIDPSVLKGFEVIRDTIGEKPANEIINKGIEAKIIDVKITQDKIERVKNILESLRNRKVIDGLKQDSIAGGGTQGQGNEGVVEVDLPRESEGVHNADVLPDKQD